MGNTVGFHLGIGGNATGIGDYMSRLDAAGITAVIKSADNYGVVNELMALKRQSGVHHIGVFRWTGELDLPDYNKSPQDAATEHWGKISQKLAQTPEFDKDVWLEVINEPDKNRMEWLSEFCKEIGQMMISEGYKVAFFGWSSGEPEPAQWIAPKASELLQWMSNHPKTTAIAVHEYDYGMDGMRSTIPFLIGRYKNIHDACQILGIRNCKIIISEWGWAYNQIPPNEQALHDVWEIGQMYNDDPDVIGAGLWYLGGGYSNISDQLQTLIEPITEWCLSQEPSPPDPPDPEPCDCSDNAREPYKREYWVLAPNTPEETAVEIFRQAFLAKRTVGFSYDDAGIGCGLSYKKVVLFDIPEDREQEFIDWYRMNYPMVNEIVFRSSTADNFAFTSWPTEYHQINQAFGANPDYYGQFGLPGHEGVDIKAPTDSHIFAVADGYISDMNLDDNPVGHNYGIFVRVRHEGGYETTYAHLERVTVSLGQNVSSGDVIGIADNTGNSSGSHLHITLKHDAAYQGGEKYIGYPYNIIDPTPFLDDLHDDVNPPNPPTNYVLLGVHTSARGNMESGELETIITARPELIKILSSMSAEDIAALKQNTSPQKWIIRAFLDFGGRDISPEQFVNDTINDVQRAIGVLGTENVFIELHNEPNLVQEGLSTSWSNGYDFSTWFISVMQIYKQHIPNIKFMFPGLSPGGTINGIRQDHISFSQQASVAIQQSDALGIHAYWAYNYPMDESIAVAQEYASRFYNKPVYITEASNNRQADAETKGAEYIEFVKRIGSITNVYGVAYFVMSAMAGTFDDEVWVKNGQSVGIAEKVGERK